MALSQGKKRAKKERAAIYFDIICGVISSALSLSGLAYVAIVREVTSWGWFTAGVTFWGGYMLFSFFLIGMGIYTWYKEKHYDERQQRTDLRAPIV